MKSTFTTALRTLALLLPLTLALHAEEKKPAEKVKGSDLVDKLLGEVQKAAGKVEGKSKELWARTKETLKLTKEDYLKRATSGLATMEAEITEIADSGSGVVSRDYFKLRLESLKLQLDYCKRDLERLKETPSEETFRVKQKGFDRTLGFLGDNIGTAKEEAGL
jgi:hypothetical protein